MPTGTNTNIFNTKTKSVNLLSNIDLIAQEVKFLLEFQKYSLFFGNNMGLGIEKFLGLTNRLATFNLIRAEIDTLISKYKRVKLLETKLTFNEKTGTLTITLTLTTSTRRSNKFNISFDVTP